MKTALDISRYVYPVMLQKDNPRSFQGTAFSIDGHLITAGHVLRFPRTYFVRIGNDCLPLDHAQWTPTPLPADDPLGYDVAIYPMPGNECPLTLADNDPEANDELEAVCWQMVNGQLMQVRTRCVVRGDADTEGYFRIATIDRITHGASGCPLIKDGKVQGILTMGRDFFENSNGFVHAAPEHRHLMQRFEENTCWVFKASHIKRFMP